MWTVSDWLCAYLSVNFFVDSFYFKEPAKKGIAVVSKKKSSDSDTSEEDDSSSDEEPVSIIRLIASFIFNIWLLIGVEINFLMIQKNKESKKSNEQKKMPAAAKNGSAAPTKDESSDESDSESSDSDEDVSFKLLFSAAF